jgi:hypothetical protein
MDLALIVEIAGLLLLPVLTAALGYSLALLRGRVVDRMCAEIIHLLRANAQDAMYQTTVARAAGVAYAFLLGSGRPPSDHLVVASACTAGSDYLRARLPNLLQDRGLKPGDTHAIVRGELGRLLANAPGATPFAPEPLSSVAHKVVHNGPTLPGDTHS